MTAVIMGACYGDLRVCAEAHKAHRRLTNLLFRMCYNETLLDVKPVRHIRLGTNRLYAKVPQ